jgi:peptidase E
MAKKTGPSPITLLAGSPGPRRSEGEKLLHRILESYNIAHPSIGYVGAASRDNRIFFLYLSSLFRRCGAGETVLAPLCNRRVDAGTSRKILETVDIVFISGGDVGYGMRVLEERGAVPWFHRLYKSGKPFLGISAGSIMLSQKWVCWEDDDDDSTARLFPCLGFAPILCDTHEEADDWTELQILLKHCPNGTTGFGIPSDGALRIFPDGSLEALGRPVNCYAKRGVKVLPRADLKPRSRDL